MTYNGWSNHATWAVNLWLFNDGGTNDQCMALAAEAMDDADSLEGAENLLADRLQEMVEGDNPLTGGCSLYADLLQAALDDVDWYELASAFLPDEWPEEEAS